MATKKARAASADFLDKWRTITRTGFEYGCHVKSPNGKVIDSPGHNFRSRSGRKNWCDRQAEDYFRKGRNLTERYIDAP
jgi:hypothetical protein